MKNILTIKKDVTDYEIVVPKGTTGKDLQIGLAIAIDNLTKQQQKVDPSFNVNRLLEAIKVYIKCLE